jgi:hypothetical protein
LTIEIILRHNGFGNSTSLFVGFSFCSQPYDYVFSLSMLKYILTIAIIFGLFACGQIDTSKQNNKTTSDTPSNANTQNSEALDKMPSLQKDKPMDTIYFWQIMDYAFTKAKFNNILKKQIILDQLTKLTPAQIQEFEIIFQQMNLKANTWNNMAAQTIIEGGSSDDRFYYFRCWLISLGRHNFEEVLKNPDYLADIDIPINKEHNYGEVLFEELIPLSDRAYSIVTGKQAEDSSFPRALAQEKGLFYDSRGETKGTEWTDEELPKIAPKLYKKFKPI